MHNYIDYVLLFAHIYTQGPNHIWDVDAHDKFTLWANNTWMHKWVNTLHLFFRAVVIYISIYRIYIFYISCIIGLAEKLFG